MKLEGQGQIVQTPNTSELEVYHASLEATHGQPGQPEVYQCV